MRPASCRCRREDGRRSDTAVAMWIAAGAGHASVSFTLDRYGHLYPEADLTLRDRLDAIWSARRADPSGGQHDALTCQFMWWA